MNKRTRYSPEVRERAVRLLFDHRGEYPSEWAALVSIASKIGCTPETLRKWVRRTEVDQGQPAGMTTFDREQLLELKRENRELRRAHEILPTASAFFAQAQLDRRPKYLSPLSRSIRAHTGLSRSVSNCRSPHRRITSTKPVRMILTGDQNAPSMSNR